MNECSGMADPKEVVDSTGTEPRREATTKNPIITPNDPERWPLLEMQSQACDLPISSDDEQVIGFMDALLDQLNDEAAGLAAIQVGYPRRIFLLRNGVDENGHVENNVYINPVILAVSREQKADGEACLSLPGMGARFKRPKSVTLGYFDISGSWQTETFTGFFARAVMHEMDHLNGILIASHLEKEIAKQPRRTSFGMLATPQRLKAIASRRAKKQRARKARRHQKATGR